MISVLSCYCSLVFTLLSGVIHYTKSTLNNAPFFCCLNQIYLSLCSTQKLMKKMALIVNIWRINQSFILRGEKPRNIRLHAWVYIGRSLLKYTICSPQSAAPLHTLLHRHSSAYYSLMTNVQIMNGCCLQK